jgi:predicted DNA-binding transcriptional regulator YafY
VSAKKTLRWLSIFEFLTASRMGLTCEGILKRINESEYLEAVNLRTVQRDMKQMAESGVVRLSSGENEVGATVWRRLQSDLPMTPLAASTLKLSLRYMHRLLPPAALESLREQELHADRVLALRAAEQPGVRPWVDKVRVIPGGHTLLAPTISDQVAAAVYESLATERKLRATYHRPGAGEVSRRDYSVLALIARPPKYQILVRTNRDPFVLNIHRIREAEVLADRSEWPQGFALDDWIAGGEVNTRLDGPSELVLTTTPALADLWEETPLGAGQQIERLEGGARLTVTLPQTEALSRYLLSLGSQVVVEAPAALRDWLAREVKLMLNNMTRCEETAE